MAGTGAVGGQPGGVGSDAVPGAVLDAGCPAVVVATAVAPAAVAPAAPAAAWAPAAPVPAAADIAPAHRDTAVATATTDVAADRVDAGVVGADGVDTEVGDADVVEELRERWRQVSRAYAAYLEAVAEVDRAALLPRSGPDRGSSAWKGWEWSAAEIAAALTFTGRRADSELAFARTLVGRLPLVLAALRAGELDQHKARVFADHLADLSAGQIERICGRLVPRAAGWTTGQLAARLLREVHAVDAGHVRRRYQRAVRERGVSGVLAPDGTATITAHGLAPAEAAAAAERLEQLADAVHRSGHPGTVHQIRADLFVRLLDGRYDGLTSTQMIAAMLAEAAAWDGGSAWDGGAVEGGGAARGGGAGQGHGAVGGDGTVMGTSGGRCSGADRHDAHDGLARAGGQGPVERAGERRPVSAVGRRRGVEVRIGLTTLLGLDEHPAELPGWGPIVASEARLLVARQHRAEWRIAVTDAEGHLLHATTTRRRPRTPPPPGRPGDGRSSPPTGQARGGIVEIHVPATVLLHLADDLDDAASAGSGPAVAEAWAGVIADIARRHRRHDDGVGLDVDPGARFAGAALRRHVQMRDRTCVAPGCRRPARKAEQDHTRDHHRGGGTVRANLAPLCRRHHAMKHQAGWSLEQPAPGVFCWRSPLGQVHRTRGEPIGPDLPAPLPRDRTDGLLHDLFDPGTARMSDGPILSRPLGAEPARPPPPPPVDLDDLPPF